MLLKYIATFDTITHYLGSCFKIESNKNEDGSVNKNFILQLKAPHGMGRKDKLITFLTTNHKDELDTVILRPGRVDYKLEFTYATNYQISKMYDMYFDDNSNKDDFIKIFKNKRVTTCVLQKFLFENRDVKNIMDKVEVLEEFITTYSNFGKNLYT